MPDSLPGLLYPWERRAAADRLWAVISMIDRKAPLSDLREAIRFTAVALEDPVWVAKDRPVNAEEARG